MLSEGPSRDDELSIASDTPSSLGQERLIMVANMLPLLAERDADTQVCSPGAPKSMCLEPPPFTPKSLAPGTPLVHPGLIVHPWYTQVCALVHAVLLH